MIVFALGHPNSPKLKPGDIAFIAGNPAHPEAPSFEHVAIIASEATPTAPIDWQEVRVYGMPECPPTPSAEDDSSFQTTVGLPASNEPTSSPIREWMTRWGRHLFPRDGESCSRMGRPDSLTNLIMRPQADAAVLAARLKRVALDIGQGLIQYEPSYRLDYDAADGTLRTNCLGFVMHVLTRSTPGGFPAPVLNQLIQTPFDFPEPYTVALAKPDERKHPAPGHLACALHRKNQSQPFGGGMSREQVEATALAKKFLEGLVYNGEIDSSPAP